MQSVEATVGARRVIPAEREDIVPGHHTVVIAVGRIGAVLPHARARSAFGAAGNNDPDVIQERPLVSRGRRPMLARVFGHESNPARIDLARRRFLEHHRAGVAVRTRLFPGWNRSWGSSEGQGARRTSPPTSTHG